MVPKSGAPKLCLGVLLSYLENVSPEERGLIESAELREVRFEPTECMVRILMEVPDYFSDSSLTKIQEAAIKAMPGILNIRVEKIVHASDPNALAALFAKAWPGIVEETHVAFPTTGPWLHTARAQWQDDTLTVQVASEFFARRLRESGCDKTLATLCASRMGQRPQVRFSVGEVNVPDLAIKNEKHITNNEEIPEVKKSAESLLILGSASRLKDKPVPMKAVTGPLGHVLVEGELFGIDWREGRKTFFCATIADYTGALRIKIFDPDPKLKALSDGDYVRVGGRVAEDKFDNELALTPHDVARVRRHMRVETSVEKRVELNLHTKFSRMSGLIDMDALIARVKSWGWEGVAITDDAVVQSFPRAYAAAKKAGIKLGLGCQLNWVNDLRPVAWNIAPRAARAANSLFRPAIVFDLETTGLGAFQHKAIEIAGYRVVRGIIEAEFHSMINPGEPLSEVTRRITGITDENVADAPAWPAVLAKFREFVGDAILVAHNISFDSGFLRADWPSDALHPLPPLVDTIGMARILFKGVKNFQLGTVAKAMGVPLVDAHRASDDAKALARLYILMLEKFKERGVTTIEAMNELRTEMEPRKIPSQDVPVLVQSQAGMKNLYRIVSTAHLDHFWLRPRTPASFLAAHRDGLLVGSGAGNGPVVEAILYGDDTERIVELARGFDYLEVAPPATYADKIGEGTLRGEEGARALIRAILEVGRRAERPVVAVGRAYHLDPHERDYRKILESRNADNLPSLHLRTTTEMLEDFAFLGEETARQLVVAAPHDLFARLDDVSPLPKGFFPPSIDGAEDELRAMTLKRMQELYGAHDREIPEIVRATVEKELKAIIGNGFAVLYLIAQRLVSSSRKNGYVVGSRGSVGSSVVAFLTGITEVNPLPPHYRCDHCGIVDFVDPSVVKGTCGPDLPPRDCCGTPMIRDGYRIPFEAFMGLKGDKVPDIDLNFANEYQECALAEIEETFGKEHVFRAGTINTLQQKNAFGFVKKFCEERALTWTGAEMDRHAHGITEVSRTTGQHPGGMVIIPRDMAVTDFMPVQMPADSDAKRFITTHFDFHSYEGTVVKVDALGHLVPTAIRLLQDLTGVDPMTVPINDPEVISLFSSPKALGLNASKLGCQVGTLGVPEFGTPFVVQILVDTRPTTVEELIRISGVSHGTDVWRGNAQELIRAGTAKLSEVIATREDIMNELVKRGMDAARAFKIMEAVRKGKGITADDEQLMRKHRTPDWVMNSCRKIKYMFPKAHAVAYVLMSLRIAWFKVHHPAAYYAMYSTLNISDFMIEAALGGERAVSKWLSEVRAKEKERTATPKEKSSAVVMEVIREMFLRGIELRPMLLGKSDALKFTVEERAIRAPFAAIEGLGEKVATRMADEMARAPFQTIEELVERTGFSRTVVDRLRHHGAFGSLPESDQLALF